MKGRLEDSHRTRRRIVAFLLAQRGRVSAGQNDSNVRWFYEKIELAGYKHHRVGDLYRILIAMRDADLVTLEWAMPKSTRISAVSLGKAADVETVDEEDFDLFKGSIESAYALVAILQGKNKKLEQQVQDSEQALEELLLEERAGAMSQGQSGVGDTPAVSIVPTCDHEAEIRQLKANFAGIQARAAAVHHAAIERMIADYESRLLKLAQGHNAYRIKVNQHKSRVGHELAQLRQQLQNA